MIHPWRWRQSEIYAVFKKFNQSHGRIKIKKWGVYRGPSPCAFFIPTWKRRLDYDRIYPLHWKQKLWKSFGGKGL